MAENKDKRNEILTSARALFKKKGFHKTKMEEIAVNAGVGKGTLYEYFKSKQDIFEESCIESVLQIRENVEKISSKDITFKEKIIEIYSNKQKCPDIEDITMESILTVKNIVSDRVVKAIMNNFSDIHDIIVKIIDQGKDEGVIIKSIPSEIIACSVIGTMGECFRLKIIKKDKTILDYEMIFNLFFNGFGVK